MIYSTGQKEKHSRITRIHILLRKTIIYITAFSYSLFKWTLEIIIIFFSIAKFDKSDSYTSKALRLRVNPKGGDFGNKSINNLKVQRNEDSHKSKLKVTPFAAICS